MIEPAASLHRHTSWILLCLLTILLNSLIFEPLDVWPIAYVCLAPWIVMLVLAADRRRGRWVVLYSYLMALAYFLINVHWLINATAGGYVALSFYLAVYFPLVGGTVRLCGRRWCWPLGLVFPLVWTGSEMLRAVVITGFPWFFLSHSQYQLSTLTQISDITGAYGVTFLVASFNGTLADAAIYWWRRRAASRGEGRLVSARPLQAGIGVSLGVLLVLVGYGRYQLSRDTMTDGPLVAILQGDYLSFIDREEATSDQRRDDYYSMLQAAAKEADVDLFLLPELPWQMYLNPEGQAAHKASMSSFHQLRAYAENYNAYIVTGAGSIVYLPPDDPNDKYMKMQKWNSAYVLPPDGSAPQRYDKVHLVLFGEVVPFRKSWPWLYLRLNALVPFSDGGKYEFSFEYGEGFKLLTMSPPSQPNKEYHFGVPICYEDVMPYVSRRFVTGPDGEKRADFLLNISNDSWFGRGVQQPQHLAICTYRAVENRVGIARSVNTGISALIDPDGRIQRELNGERETPWPRKSDYLIGRIMVDSRSSLYSRYGDWFGWTCVAVWAAILLRWLAWRATGANRRAESTSAAAAQTS